MSSVSSPTIGYAKIALLTANLNQTGATYTAGTVSGGDILIKSITPFVSIAATGLTSVVIQTNNTTSDAILASTLLASLTGGKNLTVLSTPIYLPSGKLITYTIVGNGTGGQINLAVEYYPASSANAVIS